MYANDYIYFYSLKHSVTNNQDNGKGHIDVWQWLHTKSFVYFGELASIVKTNIEVVI